MELEKQVTSLELSKRLKELGVKQGSLWYWWRPNRDKENWRITQLSFKYSKPDSTFDLSAFTVAELGEMLPKGINYGIRGDTWACWGHIYKYNKEHDCQDMIRTSETNADTEADARAKMLIYLIENKLYRGVLK